MIRVLGAVCVALVVVVSADPTATDLTAPEPRTFESFTTLEHAFCTLLKHALSRSSAVTPPAGVPAESCAWSRCGKMFKCNFLSRFH